MAKLTYTIVEHDGGWAYKVGSTFSETFRSHEEARRAAENASAEQQVAGTTDGIQYEDAQGKWHEELADGRDRPQTEIADDAENG
ncbi:MAG: hypothetical protein ACTHNH_21605 [Mesorhizobium sp.]|jgi:hypothetical protein|uniref:DUF2188 domain-containing protein n=1 Tax=Ollibium composti TaxID=2675109 RepID=A0ABY2QBW3_9HYPH|nr:MULTISPECIES: hypothetical protein [Mesorhizobium]QDB99226.1 hypothetical protein FGU64_01670 [Mesorhizobium sp. 8]THF58344.1 hypothetical protein E6C48_06945 [Mesorhizobium composti]